MKKFEEVVHEELQKSEVFFEEYNGNFIPSDEKGVLLRKNGRLILFSWLKFARDWVSPEDHQAKVDELNRKIDWLEALVDDKNEEMLRMDKIINEVQPEIPEVPQFVADWYEGNKDDLDYMIYETCAKLQHKSEDEFEQWFGEAKNYSITTLISMKNGYTVAKEKWFYLADVNFGFYISDLSIKGVTNPVTIYKERARQFSQKEIESMETGSYEQIEVEG